MTIHLVEIQQARITNETITWGSRSRTKGRKIRHSSEILSTRERTLVTDLVPSEMACLESSPGRIKRTEVWISREEMVDFLEYDASSENKESVKKLSHSRKQHVLDASVAMRSKISLTNELRMAIALFEIPVSGWTCLRTIKAIRVRVQVTAKMAQENAPL